MLLSAAWLLGPVLRTSSKTPARAPDTQTEILPYIHNAWRALGRSTSECSSLADLKIGTIRHAVLYVPRDAVLPPSIGNLARCRVQAARLPARIRQLGEARPERLNTPGLLYLPNRYVVPGGRFNEMYGWDSYFIIRGLLHDGERDLARGMIENFFYEIENYGAVLNANRTYYLTRSQPPFLTSMVMAQYAADKAAGKNDLRWLTRAYQYAKRDHAMWTRTLRLAGRMARYFDVGEGPVPEIADHPEYYANVANWLAAHPPVQVDYFAEKGERGIGPEFLVPIPRTSKSGTDRGTEDGRRQTSSSACSKKPCPENRVVRFTADYYKGDRAMRESGFDVSFRFGPFGGSTHHFAPVCLNSLLYKAEKDLSEMARVLGRPREVRDWAAKADGRKTLINRYLWNSAKGMFFDYDVRKRRQSTYDYAATFYPLWAGLATGEQAKAVVRNLAVFEHPGGLAMSRETTGVQWDKPYGWAPVQMIAVEGMRRYGFDSDANRVAVEFLGTVIENFHREGTIREKYNVVKRTTEAQVTAGYQTNVVGFGWTNGVFLVLLHDLPAAQQKRLLETARDN